jgi:hypothetical protein
MVANPRPGVRDYLLSKAFDVSLHQQCTLTASILEESASMIAMRTDHRPLVRG